MAVNDIPRTLWWEDNALHLIDQTRLPLQGDVLVCNTYEGVMLAIQSLAVRGAPAIGIAGAFGLALWALTEGLSFPDSGADYLARAHEVAEQLASARPTAVNLSWAVHKLCETLDAAVAEGLDPQAVGERLLDGARQQAADDEAANRALGAAGAALFSAPTKFLTHCNAGSLATAFYGTALGVIYAAHEQEKVEHVWVDETRPVNQGSRLTAWELLVAGVPSTLICDNMAATVMREGWVDAVIVGADRICANGDTANKIGTLGLAVLAKEFDIPFYVAAPTSTIDLSLPDGSGIVIEERDPREIEGFTASGQLDPNTPAIAVALDKMTAEGAADLPLTKGHRLNIARKGGGYAFDGWFKNTPSHVQVFNPAFDLTPATYIRAYITEKGVVTAADIPSL
ncbi:MAG: S-methyl-5-thioribose-1-phosphate isomerase [Actinomycetes bacterium]|jgi:methylthioribose-1-phosphate isomerase|nr:S-methyl-5-thioribose-1-phosphate isomerase [Actinomycetes bacterium]